jgi:nucleotide-binding universal stress UspA family protein
VPKSRKFLVPIDFSKGSEAALEYAMAMGRESNAKLILLHVVPAAMAQSSEGTRFDLYNLLERDARANLARFIKRRKLAPGSAQVVLARGVNPAEIITQQAKKLRATMIIMGSHGRTGLPRFFLGSVAERTLRLAHCPVLIVKK